MPHRTLNGVTTNLSKPILAAALAISLAGGLDLAPAVAAEVATEKTTTVLKLMTVEDLMNLTVTSVSKKAEKLSGAPAAIAVISQDDIRHSGATTIPDALRLSPGVQVARVDAHQWAVGVRGFNDTFEQKLLVLMDGRSIYTPLFSGTLWQAQDTMLEDLERIEVIRGPGGTVWGANAVNGVISLVSKPAKDTQGLLVSGGGGSYQTALAGLRYGGKLGENTTYRVYGKSSAWGDSPLVGGGDADDAWWRAQGGFRLDHEPSDDNLFTLQGDYYTLDTDTTVPQVQPSPPANTSLNSQWKQQGGNVLGRWTHRLSDDSDLSVQTYYDYTKLNLPLAGQQLHTFDLDARHRFQLGSRQEIVWGGGYRLYSSRLKDSAVISFADSKRNDQLANAFVQDEIALVPDSLRLTLGSKVEHNDYTGFEFEPSGRLAWTPNDRQTIWAAVSRAVRTPSQIEADGRVNLSALPANPPLNPLPSLVALVGNHNFKSETVIAYELGYRIQPHERLSIELAGFVNDYDDLRGTVDRIDFSTAPFGYVQIISELENNRHGTVYGGEISATWQAAEWWRLYASYSLTEADLKSPPNALTGAPTDPQTGGSRYQVAFRSSFAMGREVDLDVMIRYVDSIMGGGFNVPGVSTPNTSVKGYASLDLRLAWRPATRLELSIVGQNLLEDGHREFNPTFVSTQYTEVPRSVFAQVTWSF